MPLNLKPSWPAFFPQGQKVRVAWGQGSSGTSIYVVDSDDGVVRELTPASLFPSSRKITVPFITRDGKRVAFIEENSGVPYSIDWDGSNLKKLFSTGIANGKPALSTAPAHRSGAAVERYSLDSRRLTSVRFNAQSRSGAEVRGVVIRRVGFQTFSKEVVTVVIM